MTEVTIDSVCPKGLVYPMLINFQNGYPSENFESECAILQDKDGTKTIATELADLVYSGNEEKEDLCRTLILARDRNTGKVRLIEVGCADLKPYSKVDLDDSQLHETSVLELSRKFGSKKQKKQMEQREKLKVNVQTVTEQMETATANITVDQLDLSEYNKNDSEDYYIPPIDRDATKVEDVYPLDKIMSEDDYEQIHSEIKENYEENLIPYMKSYIKGKTLSPRMIVLAAYASELIKYLGISYIEIRKKDFTICRFSNTLNSILMNNFVEVVNGKKTKSPRLKDKVICHVMVLMLLLGNYKFELEPLCEVLKISPKHQFCLNKVRLVGAHIVTGDGGKRVHLKLPLAPKASMNRRKSAKF